mmetsp:Transcript_6685/g.25783  ORF Transcript_6685/g.25783 Transcript_6685/m.25783 type:complete len:234 (+) Transcript_6685:2516-3217(+)
MYSPSEKCSSRAAPAILEICSLLSGARSRAFLRNSQRAIILAEEVVARIRRNVRRSRVHRLEASVARMVAALGESYMRASSPKLPPGEYSPTRSSSTNTSQWPDSKTKKSLPASPCLMTSSPAVLESGAIAFTTSMRSPSVSSLNMKCSPRLAKRTAFVLSLFGTTTRAFVDWARTSKSTSAGLLKISSRRPRKRRRPPLPPFGRKPFMRRCVKFALFVLMLVSAESEDDWLH